MISFFRINDPYRIVYIFLLLVVVRIPVILLDLPFSVWFNKWLTIGELLAQGKQLYVTLFDNSSPIAALYFQSVHFLFGTSEWPHYIISILVCTHQAWLFNHILNSNKALKENSFIPAYAYIILINSSFDFFIVTPALLANTFILLTLSNILKRLDKKVTDEMFFNSGIFMAIATLIYFPSIIFLFTFLIILILHTSAIPRRILLMLFGYLFIILLSALYFAVFGDLSNYGDQYFYASFSKVINYVGYRPLLGLSAVLLVITLYAALRTNIRANFSNFQGRIQQVFIYLFITGFLACLGSRETYWATIIFLFAPLSFFVAHYFVVLRKRFWLIVNHWGYIAICIGIYLFTSDTFKISDSLHTHDIFISRSTERKTAMIMADSMSAYSNYQPTTAFVNWPLSKSFFDQDISQQEVIFIHKELAENKPNTILDPSGLFPSILEFIPELQQQYKMTEKGVYTLSGKVMH